MFRILESSMIVPNIHLLKVEAPAIAKVIKPGQFVILRVEEDGERIPLSVSDWNRETGTLTLLFKNVGTSTNKLASLRNGMEIPTVVGPLGKPTEISEFGRVLCLGGCYGIGSIYPIARALKEKGNEVTIVIEARSSYLLYWEEMLESVSDSLVKITRDGTIGYKGHVGILPEIIGWLGKKIDRIIINGCTYLLMRGSEASQPLGITTITNLNPIMIDGTGMCGVCRVTVGSGTKFACVDGPDFNGHEVDWDELLKRRKTYLPEEEVQMRTSRCEDHCVRHVAENDD
jgi:ferredoxin--NADP+ reductase